MFYRRLKCYILRNGLLYHIGDIAAPYRRQVVQLVIPDTMKKYVMSAFHDHSLAGHLGRYKTYEKIKRRFFWINMYKDIKKYIKGCLICAKTKTLPPYDSGLLQPLLAKYPFQYVAIDIFTMPESTKGYNYVLIMVDLFTRWMEIAPMRNKTSLEVADQIWNKIICHHSCPKKRKYSQTKGINFTLK